MDGPEIITGQGSTDRSGKRTLARLQSGDHRAIRQFFEFNDIFDVYGQDGLHCLMLVFQFQDALFESFNRAVNVGRLHQTGKVSVAGVIAGPGFIERKMSNIDHVSSLPEISSLETIASTL
jgi:hypothetical protein